MYFLKNTINSEGITNAQTGIDSDLNIVPSSQRLGETGAFTASVTAGKGFNGASWWTSDLGITNGLGNTSSRAINTRRSFGPFGNNPSKSNALLVKCIMN